LLYTYILLKKRRYVKRFEEKRMKFADETFHGNKETGKNNFMN